jgi:hypothetical protein
LVVGIKVVILIQEVAEHQKDPLVAEAAEAAETAETAETVVAMTEENDILEITHLNKK